MTIRHLQIFNTVCDCGSITAAAGKLNMAQPAVSCAIKELETFYNTKLFDRMNRRIYLTESGTLLRQYSSNILDQYDEAAAVLRDQEKSKHCAIGVNVSIGETGLSAMLHKLKAEIPGIALEVFVDNTLGIEEKLAANEIDFCIVDSLTDQANRVVIPIYTSEMAAVCAPSYREEEAIPLDVLAQDDLLMHEENSGNRTCIEAVFRTHGFTLKPTIVSTSDLCLIELAKSGLGITILPREIVYRELSAGSLKELTVPGVVFQRHYSIAFREQRYRTNTVKQAIAILTRYAGRPTPMDLDKQRK